MVELVQTSSELVSPVGGDLGWSLLLGARWRLDVTLSPARDLLSHVVDERVDIASNPFARSVKNVPSALDFVPETCLELWTVRNGQ